MTTCAMGRPTTDPEYGPIVHTDTKYLNERCLGPSCTAKRPRTDTERLDWLLHMVLGSATWFKLDGAKTTPPDRTDIDAAMDAEEREAK